ncbi:MAG: NAD(P)H-hydrate dehydratase [Candidatus Thorarchaeota archaeon]|jgi:NAD(P)H-hydrate epimerase
MEKEPITTEDMRILELNAEYLGVTHSMLMQNAGREVARVVTDTFDVKDKLVVILCGLGGNGGDGIVAARYLDEAGADVDVYLLGHETSIRNKDTLENWEILNNLHGITSLDLPTETAVKSCKAILEADVLVDGIMGFGLRTKLREPLLIAVKMINKSSAIKYSIDIPSGIDSETGKVHGAAVKADHTIALHAPKIGMTKDPECSGKVHIVSIGIPKEATYTVGPGDLRRFDQPRPLHSRKGDFGKILVVGGSDVYSGAPALTGLAALRAGADLVSVLAPEPVTFAIRSYSPNLMVTSLGTQILISDSVDVVLDMASENDVIALGPGLGIDQQTKLAVMTIVERLVKKKKSLVIDADGLKAIAGSEIKMDSERCVLTPHWGELEILMDKKQGDSFSLQNRIDRAVECASEYNSVILLKGPVDVIAHPNGNFKLNREGAPAMTVGGTGDVLTGITAGLLGQHGTAFQAATAAAFISGNAGEIAFDQRGDHIVATDCIENIHRVFDKW